MHPRFTVSTTIRPIAAMCCALSVICTAACSSQRSLVKVRDDGVKALDRGDTGKALADFREYNDRYPGTARGEYFLGRALAAADQPLEAKEHLWVAHTLEPHNDEYFVALCDSLSVLKLDEDLYRVLRQRAMDRGRVIDYLLLGHYAQRAGDADEAAKALRTAAELDGGASIEPQLALADFYAAIGNKPESLRRLRMAYFLDPTDAAVNQRIRAMGEIPGPSFALEPQP